MGSIVSTMKAGLLMQPVAGVLRSSLVTTDALNATAQTFTNTNLILWNAGLFNTQGEIWEAVNGSDATQGCRNAATPRTSGGVRYNHVQSFEFLMTGSALDIAFIGGSYYDIQVYVEDGGKMYKAQAAPLTGTTTGAMNRRMVFSAPINGRIRVHLAGGVLVGIRCEQSAIVKPSKDRILNVLDGGEFANPAGNKQASGTSYLTQSIADYLFELTGWVWARRAQPNTGYFYNSSATVTADTAASDNSTRFFSQSRKDWLANTNSGNPAGINIFTQKPLFYVIMGTRDDGGRSGATGLDTGAMQVRALACYQWLRSQDALMQIVQISPSCFNGGGSAGALDGAPTSGNGHDLNRQEQNLALAKVAKCSRINSFGPTSPWWTGSGSNGSVATSQQAALIGADAATFTAIGNYFYAWKIAADLAQFNVSAVRGRGQA